MSHGPEPQSVDDERERRRARRHRAAGAMFAVGIVLLFVASWAFPEGLIHVARASAGEYAIPMSTRGWVTAIFGPIALVASGVLLFGGFWIRQRNKEAVSHEDRALDEAWGDETFTDYNPQDYR
ncbi:hypothetical protein [Kocuria sp.]|uniref:hypothetical protein n=1 Tax=Kocuria sp. TaxID=1871328 RepID=UPI0026DF5E9A|nr:hypothetical protein [Kocuria sp.]MDO5619708.1 hypothetical protein [Kocuria sp.]